MYIVMDHIEGEYPEFDTLAEAKKYILDNYTDSKEGIHPEIEGLQIVKYVCGVLVEPDLDYSGDGEVYNIKFSDDSNK